jgi:asparagine synthase (glutamine-hydrolysing)
MNGSKGEFVKKAMLRNSNGNDLLSKMQELDMRSWLVDDVLTKVDRASMSNSLEVRVPLLDHEFAELAFTIPTNLRIKGGSRKYIFKKSVSKLLPDSIMSQPKRGFSVPLKHWFKKDLNEYLNDTICSQSGQLSQFFNPQYIKDLVKDSQTSMRDLHQQLWSLVFLNEWLKTQSKAVNNVS